MYIFFNFGLIGFLSFLQYKNVKYFLLFCVWKAAADEINTLYVQQKHYATITAVRGRLVYIYQGFEI